MNNTADRVSPGKSTEALPAAALDPRRCQFSFADGRRCRMPRSEAHPALCVSHARAGCGLYLEPTEKKTRLEPDQTPNLADELAPLSGDFTTATDVNHALGKLFSLLAHNRIPRRNAVALGYLAQLLLQTLPGVRDELTRCLGDEAWDETLESVFCEDKTEDETEAETEAETDNTEDEAENDPELPVYEGDAEPASKRQPPLDEIDEKDAPAQAEPVPLFVVTAPAHTEAAHTEAALTETKDPQAEIAPEPKPEESPEPKELIAEMPAPWSYWKELEQGVWAAAHAIK